MGNQGAEGDAVPIGILWWTFLHIAASISRYKISIEKEFWRGGLFPQPYLVKISSPSYA